ncbi:hypothetical protein B0H13DRAFT_2303977 [Mycena leptocephala]|nr:hypothetical protein B0H13DRAFT_2303977 [Mycena leptocephala]
MLFTSRICRVLDFHLIDRINDSSGASVIVSDPVPEICACILNVSGSLDSVAKAFGLIVRLINWEPFDHPSKPGSLATSLYFIQSHSWMRPAIEGYGISKIEEVSAASLAFHSMGALSVTGVADAVHLATYYIGSAIRHARPPHGTIWMPSCL